MKMIITILSAFVGALVANFIKLPVPFMIGSMLGVGVYNIATAGATLWARTKFVTQSISGAYIGLSLKKSDLKNLKQLVAPVIILVGCYLVFTASVGLVMCKVFKLDVATSFLICVPGGVTEISLMADELGAQPAIVSLVQTIRLVSVYAFFPSWITFMSKHIKKEDVDSGIVESNEEQKDTFFDKIIPNNVFVKAAVTIAAGLLGGYLGELSGLPSGVLSGAMIVTILLNVNTKRGGLDRKYKKFVQVFSGALIGKSISMQTVKSAPSVIIPAIFMMICYFAANYLISFLMAKTKKVDRISAMFASSPGGASDMALIASEIGGDSPVIAVMQICRLIACYALFPTWVKILVSIFG